MDCYEVTEVVYQYLDAEVSIEVRQQVMSHLSRCGDCDTAVEIERRVKALIAKACACADCPEGLEDRLMEAIRALE